MHSRMHTSVGMARNIAVANDVYEMLSKEKKKGESFSEVIRRLAPRKGSIMEFFGAWGDLSAKESKAIEEAMESVDQPLNEALKRRRI